MQNVLRQEGLRLEKEHQRLRMPKSLQRPSQVAFGYALHPSAQHAGGGRAPPAETSRTTVRDASQRSSFFTKAEWLSVPLLHLDADARLCQGAMRTLWP